jgi:hypothetical protein
MDTRQESRGPVTDEEAQSQLEFNLSNLNLRNPDTLFVSSRTENKFPGEPVPQLSGLERSSTNSYKSKGDIFSLPLRPHPDAITRAEATLFNFDSVSTYQFKRRRLSEGATEKKPLVKRSKQSKVIPRQFSGSIIIEDDEGAAITYAKLEYDETSSINNKPRAVFWTNAYCNTKGVGAGIAYKTRKNNFVWRQYHITTFACSTLAKAISIGQALENAWKLCISVEDRPSTVVVYTDSAAAFKTILNPESKNVADRTSASVVFSHRLKQLGVHVELRWVPTSSISEVRGLAQSRAASKVKHKYQQSKSEPLRPVVEIKDLNMRHESKKKGIYMARSTVQELPCLSDGESPSSEGSADYFTNSTASTLHLRMDRMAIGE